MQANDEELQEIIDTAEEMALHLAWELNPTPDRGEILPGESVKTQTENIKDDLYVFDTRINSSWVSLSGESKDIDN